MGGAGPGGWRDNSPRPPQAAGGRNGSQGAYLRGAGPGDGTDLGTPEQPQPSNCRRPAAGDVAVETNLLHVLPRGRGATIPGTGRRPGQTLPRARSSNDLTASDPPPTSECESTRTRRHFHHT